jgi:hypothetical protein
VVFTVDGACSVAPILQSEDALDERVYEREIGTKYRRVRLSEVPNGPLRAKRIRKGVVFVQDRSNNLLYISKSKLAARNRYTVNAPMRNTVMSTALFFFGKRTLNNKGMGMQIIMRSDEILKTALVMR